MWVSLWTELCAHLWTDEGRDPWAPPLAFLHAGILPAPPREQVLRREFSAGIPRAGENDHGAVQLALPTPLDVTALAP